MGQATASLPATSRISDDQVDASTTFICSAFIRPLCTVKPASELDTPEDIPVLSSGTSAEAVAYQVGYASASQFSREYARLFGQPPRRDVEALRAH